MPRGRWVGVAVGAAVLSAAAACTPGADAPDVAHIEATGLVPRSRRLGLMDAGLVGLRSGRNDEPDNVVVSHDGGRTWSGAELPGRPDALELVALHVDRHLAAVAGRDTEGASTLLPLAKPQFIVWTTTDGDDWARHVLVTAGGVVGAPTLTAVGPLLVASTSSTAGFNLFTSSDRGASWRRADVSGLDHPPGTNLTPEVAAADADTLRIVLGRGDGWPTPVSGVVYGGGADARRFEPVEGTARDGVTFGDPVVDGDRLLIPELDDERELVALTTIG